MTPNVDPWRTLGLAPGASADDVRRAYRRLAKANHPDAAGETALPRFLAIQAAYEQLVGASVRRAPAFERNVTAWRDHPALGALTALCRGDAALADVIRTVAATLERDRLMFNES